MPKIIASDTLTVLEADERDQRWLVELDTTPVLRYCAGRDTIVNATYEYKPATLNVRGISYGAISAAGATVVIGLDEDNDIITEVYSNGLVGVALTLTQLVRERDDDQWATAYDPITGPIAEVSGSGVTIVLRVRGVTNMRRRGGPKIGALHCRHVYKGSRCGSVSGFATCSRNWADCVARSATDAFSGLRWAPEPGAEIMINTTEGRWRVPDAPRDRDDSPFRPRRTTPRQLRPATPSTKGGTSGGKR